jgi:4-alpha-glucanotransferase
MLPLGPPDEFDSPYRSPSAFAASPALLAKPDARVTAAEVEDFVARHLYWTGKWATFAGEDAIADQVRFEREWGALRAYAVERGVRLIGDVPIYVSDEGADFAGWPELFARGEVAGTPPDSLSKSGQFWGNPLYDWPAHRASGYRWWRERFRRTYEFVDLCRIDHFRGFVSYWAIPQWHKTARRGRWRPGPGIELFRAVEQELGGLPMIAEDLGLITPPVYKLRDDLGLPGMAVLLWGFGGSPRNVHRPENHVRNQIVYTSTHDTDTVEGHFGGSPSAWEVIEIAYRSPAALAIAPVQDVLGLGSEGRMNTPGTAEGNWRWRLEPGALTPVLARRLRALAEKHGR